MKLFKISIVFYFLLSVACSDKGLTPSAMAQQTCKCIKLMDDVQAFADCQTESREMMADYRSDTLFISQYQIEIEKIIKDCMSE